MILSVPNQCTAHSDAAADDPSFLQKASMSTEFAAFSSSTEQDENTTLLFSETWCQIA
jgi:hypothetical protein